MTSPSSSTSRCADHLRTPTAGWATGLEPVPLVRLGLVGHVEPDLLEGGRGQQRLPRRGFGPACVASWRRAGGGRPRCPSPRPRATRRPTPKGGAAGEFSAEPHPDTSSTPTDDTKHDPGRALLKAPATCHTHKACQRRAGSPECGHDSRVPGRGTRRGPAANEFRGGALRVQRWCQRRPWHTRTSCPSRRGRGRSSGCWPSGRR